MTQHQKQSVFGYLSWAMLDVFRKKELLEVYTASPKAGASFTSGSTSCGRWTFRITNSSDFSRSWWMIAPPYHTTQSINVSRQQLEILTGVWLLLLKFWTPFAKRFRVGFSWPSQWMSVTLVQRIIRGLITLKAHLPRAKRSFFAKTFTEITPNVGAWRSAVYFLQR